MSSVSGQVVLLRKRNDLPQPEWGNQNANSSVVIYWSNPPGRREDAIAPAVLRSPAIDEGRRHTARTPGSDPMDSEQSALMIKTWELIATTRRDAARNS